jgi:hypothetical protein
MRNARAVVDTALWPTGKPEWQPIDESTVAGVSGLLEPRRMAAISAELPKKPRAMYAGSCPKPYLCDDAQMLTSYMPIDPLLFVPYP